MYKKTYKTQKRQQRRAQYERSRYVKNKTIKLSRWKALKNKQNPKLSTSTNA